MYSSPRPQCARMAQRLLCVPVGMNSAASKPSNAANFSCSAFTVGSSPNTSSPRGAAIMAARMAAVGCVTVSLRKSTILVILASSPHTHCASSYQNNSDAWHASLQEVLQHGVAVLGEDALRVELHALHALRKRQAGVPPPHDLAVVRPCGHRQLLGAAGAFDGQRVVAVDRELLRQASKHALLRGRDHAGLAVHQFLCANDLAAQRSTNALMAQANAEDGQLAHEVLNGRNRDTGLGRRAGSGGNHQPVGLALGNAGYSDFIVAEHLHLGAQLAKVLDDVESEAVVVVDHHEFHAAAPSRKRANSRCSKAMDASIRARYAASSTS